MGRIGGFDDDDGYPLYKFKPVQKCKWSEDEDGNWSTACRNMHLFIDGGPKDNRYSYCPYCGKMLEERRFAQQW